MLPVKSKTLKNHLSSNRAIVVERAVVKDEVITLRAELSSKNTEMEKSSIKLKKVSTELNTVLGELKQIKDAKVTVENDVKALKEKMKKLSVPVEENAKHTKMIEEELTSLKAEYTKLKNSKQELQERMDFYVGQCSEFEKNDCQLQDEITLLQSSIKKSTMDHAAEVEKFRFSLRNMEDRLVFYKDQEEVLIDENEKLKGEMNALKVHVEMGNLNEDLMIKYNLKCDMVEELLKKHEKIAAQLRRKDWEIENYQKKLDSAFEAESLALSRDIQSATIPGDILPAAPVEMRSPVAQDLSIKEKASPREVNNNEVKEEDVVVAGPSGMNA